MEELLRAVGELLQAKGESCSIVIVGGASLNLLGLVERTTKDVDIVARSLKKGRKRIFVRPEPLPGSLADVVLKVARDFGLSEDWMNTQAATQWRGDLPDFLFKDIQWRRYASLEVGIVGRSTLIALKLHAAIDRDAASVHYQDLLALAPTDAELQQARKVVIAQDVGSEFPGLLDEAISRVRADLRRNK